MSITWVHRLGSVATASIVAVALAVTFLPGATSAKKQSIVGSWRLDITEAASGRSNPSLVTFIPGGTLTTSDLPVTQTGPGPATVGYVSAAHGAWSAAGPGVVDITFDQLIADGTGAQVGTVRVIATVTMAPGGGSLTGEYVVNGVGPEGSPLFSEGGTISGSRITVQPMPSPLPPSPVPATSPVAPGPSVPLASPSGAPAASPAA